MLYYSAMRRNPASIALGVSCAVSFTLGAILWVVGNNQLRGDQLGSDYFNALNLDNGTNFADPGAGAIAADDALIWWGIGLVIFGGLLFIATLVTVAITRQMRASAEASPKSFAEYQASKDDPQARAGSGTQP
ncbi:hypothetical protein ACFQ9V_19540 [Leifsonia sp. NPDC056665]|uniref:hypothetical protein n=1 Tax=Leifsonia sp. NPDC056665 TaxID=3345901 RepID=UPI00368E4056